MLFYRISWEIGGPLKYLAYNTYRQVMGREEYNFTNYGRSL